MQTFLNYFPWFKSEPPPQNIESDAVLPLLPFDHTLFSGELPPKAPEFIAEVMTWCASATFKCRKCDWLIDHTLEFHLCSEYNLNLHWQLVAVRTSPDIVKREYSKEEFYKLHADLV